MLFSSKKAQMPTKNDALPGREQPIDTAQTHFVLGTPLKGPYAGGAQKAMFGLGCFWGAEKCFWQLPGILNTAVGYAAGQTPNPTYNEVCSGQTGHNEVVRVVFDPAIIDYETLLVAFFEAHNPTQGMRQGNDQGTQYRSGIYTYNDEQAQSANSLLERYSQRLFDAGHDAITTEIIKAPAFYFAEEAHQQYLAKNPNGYCGLGGTGISCG
jgi:peptide-methionine (S)-S-oxide reductase